MPVAFCFSALFSSHATHRVAFLFSDGYTDDTDRTDFHG